MEPELLKKLLPHEYHQYLIRNGVRADSRSLTQHRSITIKRQVLQTAATTTINSNNGDSQQQQLQHVRVSGAVNQGNTLIIGQASLKPQDHAALSDKPLNISIQLVRELQSNIRRDFQEQKETFYAQHIHRQIGMLVDFSLLATKDMKSEISLNFNVLSDDGNIISAIFALAMDMLLQLQKASRVQFVKQLAWESMVIMQEGQLIADPSLDETYVSNNHLAVTVFEDGKQLLEKSQSLRTFTNSMQSLEYGSSTMNLDEISRAINYLQKQAKQVFQAIRQNENNQDVKEFTINFNNQ